MASTFNFKVLIGDGDTLAARRLIDYLKERGFDSEQAHNGKELRSRVLEWKPNFVITDLLLPDGNAIDILRWVQTESFDPKPVVLVTSSNAMVSNVRDCIQLGAGAYILRPWKYPELLSRLVFHIQRDKAKTKESTLSAEPSDVYLNLLDVVMRECLSSRGIQDKLFNLSKMASITSKAVRCSVIRVSEDLQNGLVLASSDDRRINSLKLDLNKYPEVVYAVSSQKAVIIDNMDYDPQLAEIKKQVKEISFNAMLVFPLVSEGGVFGVLSARMDKSQSSINTRDIRFMQIMAQAMSLLVQTPPSVSLPIAPLAEVPTESPKESAA